MLNAGWGGGAFLQIADDYTWLNPHLALTVIWRDSADAERPSTCAASGPQLGLLAEVATVGPDLPGLVQPG